MRRQKQFAVKSVLNDHIAKIHTNFQARQKFSCSFCEKELLSNATLKNHIETQHKSEERSIIKCEICGKKYKSQLGYDVHFKQIHGDAIRKHECDECEWKFYTSSSLKSHKQLVHDKKGL